MARKDIQKNGIYSPTEIGSNIYVWYDKSSGPNQACVITAHGVDNTANVSSSARPPDATLYFYCPHGNNLSDTTSMGVMRGQKKYYQKVPPGGALHDYILTKAQGRHDLQGKENYANLQTGWHPQQATATAGREYMATMQNLKNKPHFMKQAAQEDYQRTLANFTDIVVDVVTIRNRRLPHLRNTITLWSTIEMLKKAGYNYKAVHCFFCRGEAGSGQEATWRGENPYAFED